METNDSGQLQDEKLLTAHSSIARALWELSDQLHKSNEWLRSHSSLVTKHDLKELENHIMSAISDFAAKQKAFNDRQDAAIANLQGDIKTLNDTITALQNSPGTITPQDQALLDDLQARASAVADKLDALDALTPPPVPPGPV